MSPKSFKIKKLTSELIINPEETEVSQPELWMSLLLKKPEKASEFYMMLKVDLF